MPKRETVFASAILAALVPAMVLSVGLHHAQGAADNCLAKPNAAPPRGSHWYYRVDQAGNRRCWFLAPQGAWPRQALSPKPAPNPPPKRASQPKATATAQPAREIDPAATYAMLSPAPPTSVNVVDGDRGPQAMALPAGLRRCIQRTSAVDRALLSAAELAAAEWPPGLAAKLGPMLAYVAAALALVMIVRKVFNCLPFDGFAGVAWPFASNGTRICGRVGASRSRRHSPTWSRRPAQRSTVASWLQYRASPNRTPAADEWAPDHDIEALDAKKACSSSCRPLAARGGMSMRSWSRRGRHLQRRGFWRCSGARARTPTLNTPAPRRRAFCSPPPATAACCPRIAPSSFAWSLPAPGWASRRRSGAWRRDRRKENIRGRRAPYLR